MRTGYYVISIAIRLNIEPIGDDDKKIKIDPFKHIVLQRIEYSDCGVMLFIEPIETERFSTEKADDDIFELSKHTLPAYMDSAEFVVHINSANILKIRNDSEEFLRKNELSEDEFLKLVKLAL